MIYIFDHVARGLARIASQFDAAEKLRGISAAILEEVQQAEDALADFAVIMTVDGASGVQLDRMGALLGERRDALPDLWYRRFIRARCAIRRSQGTPDEVCAIAAAITGSPVEYRPAYPAAYRLFVTLPVDVTPVLIARLRARILEATPAGVGMELVYLDSETPFTFDEEGMGFDDGELVEVL
jgi:hypothetical protein